MAIILGRAFGITIELHWTFVLLLLFSALYGPSVLLFIIMLFVLVVVHELAHSITARRNGISVKKIVLLPLGGASIVDLEDADPDVSFRIALAGPLLSILLGSSFGLLSLLTPGSAAEPLFQFLFEINMILGVFNLLPAFPLDGGRVLKSFLERTRDELEATELAVATSKVILVLFIAGSLAYELLSQSASGANWPFVLLWNFIIVVFIYGGAQAELDSAYVLKYTEDLRVRDVLSRNFTAVRPTTRMRDLYRVLLKEGTHIVLFRAGGRISMVSGMARSPIRGRDASILDRPVSDFGVALPTVDYADPLPKAIKRMRYEEAPIVAVMRAGKVVGVLVNDHIESIIALHMPQTPAATKNRRRTKE